MLTNQSGPPQSVVPLILSGRPPNTASLIPADRSTADILFSPLRLVIDGGHTTHTLTQATLEPLHQPSTSTSHRLSLHNTHSVRTSQCSCVGPEDMNVAQHLECASLQRAERSLRTWTQSNCFMSLICFELIARPPSHKPMQLGRHSNTTVSKRKAETADCYNNTIMQHLFCIKVKPVLLLKLADYKWALRNPSGLIYWIPPHVFLQTSSEKLMCQQTV